MRISELWDIPIPSEINGSVLVPIIPDRLTNMKASVFDADGNRQESCQLIQNFEPIVDAADFQKPSKTMPGTFIFWRLLVLSLRPISA